MKRCENPQAIGSEREERGEKEKNLKQENTELHESEEGNGDNEYISLSPWGEEDIEIEKMKKKIDELEEIKRDNEKLLTWKGRYIEDYKDAVIRTTCNKH